MPYQLNYQLINSTINKSHLSYPQRLTRLMFAGCLAYLWIVFKERTPDEKIS